MTGNTTKGFVYFIHDGRAIKIGFSQSVSGRLHDLQVASPTKLHLVGYMDGTPADESALKKKFSDIRLRGEWFEPSDLILDYVEELAAQGLIFGYSPLWRGQKNEAASDNPLHQWVRRLSKIMFDGFHHGDDRIRKVRCSTIFENCRLILNGDNSPELRHVFLANIEDLERYDAGHYAHLLR